MGEGEGEGEHKDALKIPLPLIPSCQGRGYDKVESVQFVEFFRGK